MQRDLTLGGVTAFITSDAQAPSAADASADAGRHAASGTVTSHISVERASGTRLDEIAADWRDLLARADAPNIFMDPLLMRLAADSYAESTIFALLAWQAISERPRLLGVWAFAIGRPHQSILPITVLSAPAMAHAYLATPVIDREHLDHTLTAMLDYVSNDDSLPKIIALDAMATDGATMQALNRVLATRGNQPCILRATRRPKLASTLDAKQYMEKALSSSSRKKLRQHRRRLGEKGTLESTTATAPELLNGAFEGFLRLESSGWKGRQGTALVNDPADATFTRAMIASLAARGDAWIHALTLDGEPVSMQIVLRAGPAAFTWKTAYDERLQDFSPGMLLFEDYTAAFLANESIAFVDSCSYDDSGFMGAWTERQAIAQMWINAREGRSITFTIMSTAQKSFLALRERAKAIYHTAIRNIR